MRNIASSISTTKDMISPHTAMQQQTTWHSPVPYLFGGLAAMLGLIAFALLILACSYWKLSRQLNDNNENGGQSQRDAESGTIIGDKDSEDLKLTKVYEEKILVIMAGHDNPTFLATPRATKAALVSDRNEEKTKNEKSGKVDKEIGDQEHATRMEDM